MSMVCMSEPVQAQGVQFSRFQSVGFVDLALYSNKLYKCVFSNKNNMQTLSQRKLNSSHALNDEAINSSLF